MTGLILNLIVLGLLALGVVFNYMSMRLKDEIIANKDAMISALQQKYER